MCQENQRALIRAAAKAKFSQITHDKLHKSKLVMLVRLVDGEVVHTSDMSLAAHDDANPKLYVERKLAAGEYFIPMTSKVEFAVVAGTTFDGTPWTTEMGAPTEAVPRQFYADGTMTITNQNGRIIVKNLPLTGAPTPLDKFFIVWGKGQIPVKIELPEGAGDTWNGQDVVMRIEIEGDLVTPCAAIPMAEPALCPTTNNVNNCDCNDSTSTQSGVETFNEPQFTLLV